jgi:methylmalonyl-CoA mutase N-terminal domain/subunit
VADTVDPLAGSYYIESLTNEIEKEAQDYLDKIDAMGGTLKALEKGFFHQEIEDAAFQWQTEVESGKRVIVGVNKFTIEENEQVERLELNPALREEQIERLKALRARRNQSEVQARLQGLASAAQGRDNLMPHIIGCVESLVTLGEICDTLRKVFGVYRPV